MPPNNYQNQLGGANHLPPMPVAQPATPVPMGPVPVPAASADTAAQYAAKAKQIIAQYDNDPYRLAEALNQLKAAYLAQQHHITTNKPGN